MTPKLMLAYLDLDSSWQVGVTAEGRVNIDLLFFFGIILWLFDEKFMLRAAKGTCALWSAIDRRERP